jgi:hypothetical protein
VRYLREQAKGIIKEYVTQHLPEQYQVCLSALDTILKHVYEILQDSDDNREKLQAMEVFNDTHLVKLELLLQSIARYITSEASSTISSRSKRSERIWIQPMIVTAQLLQQLAVVVDNRVLN